MSASAALAGLSAALLVLAAPELLRTLRTGRTRRRRPRRWPVLPLLAALGRRLGVAPAPDTLRARLAAAGAPSTVTPGEVMAVKTGCALVVTLLALAPASSLPGRLGPAVLLAAPLAGAALPGAWLRRRARVRSRRMAAEVADVLDLLRVCVDAGRTPAAALAEVGRRHRGALGRELRRAAEQLALGRPRGAVLDELAARCPVEQMAALTAALRRAERHGAPPAPALAALAADARAARARAVREQAAKAAPKIQLVIALQLVPAVMLLVAAALAAAFGGVPRP